MTTFTQLTPAPSDPPEPFTDRLRLAVAAYLARFKGSSREHTESDLRCYLTWCAERSLDPLAARRPHLELYIRWMQEIRRYKPSTVSRRFSVTAGSTGPASSTASWSTHPPSTSAAPPSPPTCSSRRCSPPPGNRRTRPTSRWWSCSACSACGSSRPPPRTSPISARNTATGCCGYAAPQLHPRRLHGLRNLTLRLLRRAPPRDAPHCRCECVRYCYMDRFPFTGVVGKAAWGFLFAADGALAVSHVLPRRIKPAPVGS